MEKLFTITQIVTGILLMISILLQQRGAGLGGAFGGSGSEVYSAKRGSEKIIFIASIILSIIFLAIGAIRLFF